MIRLGSHSMGLVSLCKGVDLDVVTDTCRRKKVTLKPRNTGHQKLEEAQEGGFLKGFRRQTALRILDFGPLASSRSVRHVSVFSKPLYFLLLSYGSCREQSP